MKPKPQTNIELVTHLMDFSRNGALMQCFVIEAIDKYAELTLADEPWQPNSIINQDAWKACATEARQAIKERA